MVKELGLTIGSVLLALGLAEDALRALHPQTMGYSHHTRDGLQVHVPNARGFYRRGEFSTELRFNSLGFRGGEFALRKPAGTYRILALGDSFTAGLQVDEDDLFTTGIAVSLATARDDVEVLNLGVSGYGTDDELQLLRQYGVKEFVRTGTIGILHGSKTVTSGK